MTLKIRKIVIRMMETMTSLVIFSTWVPMNHPNSKNKGSSPKRKIQVIY
jgi:hypothetical protein